MSFGRSLPIGLLVMALLGFGAPGARAQDFVTDGLVAFWSFDEDTIEDEIIHDACDGEHEALIVGDLELVEGKINECLRYDGAGNYVEIPPLGQWEAATVECWAMAETLTPTYQGIVSTWQWAAGKVHFKFEGGQIQVHKNDGVKIRFGAEANRWYHIVYTTDTITNELKLYVDGVLVDQGAAGTTPENMDERRIGSEHDGRYLTGLVDEVRLYDRVLDEDEVMQNYEVASNACTSECPRGLRFARQDGGVRLTWKSGDVAANTVDVERDGDLIGDDVPVDNANPYFDDPAPAPGIHEYTLTFDVPGQTCEPLVRSYNGCITGLEAARGPDGVALSWTSNLAYAGIAVRRNDGLVEEELAVIDGGETTYLDATVTPGLYTYSVVPTNGSCEPVTVEIEVYPSEDVSPWTSVDIGGALPGGIEKEDVDAFNIFGGGADIWGTADAFRFTYRELEGNFVIQVRLENLDLTNSWAKAGLMARASTDPDSEFVFLLGTPTPGGQGVDLQWRDAPGLGAANSGASGDGTYLFPDLYLRLVRLGDTFLGYYSQDGDEWIPYGSHTLALGETALVGLAVTSHDAALITTAEFREIAIGEEPSCMPEGLACNCQGPGAGNTLTWTNSPDFPYIRLRIYRIDAGGKRLRLRSLSGDAEEFTDTRDLDTLPPGPVTYEVIPVLMLAEEEGCKATCQCGGVQPGGFVRGDADGDGKFTIGDCIQILERIFAGRPEFASKCEKTGDVDDNGVLTIGDPINLLNYLFASGVAPTQPFPNCGPDPTPDTLPCDDYPQDKCP